MGVVVVVVVAAVAVGESERVSVDVADADADADAAAAAAAVPGSSTRGLELLRSGLRRNLGMARSSQLEAPDWEEAEPCRLFRTDFSLSYFERISIA